jgi:outer membrane protein assembly factor BamB
LNPVNLVNPVKMKNFLSILSVAASVLSVRAGDWPNWRGPNHDGVSSETGWSTQWPADGPSQLWKASVGTGFASVSVRGNRVYTIGNQNNTDSVFCLDADTGKVVWKYSYACALNPTMYEGGPSATPTLDANHVFTFSKNGDLFCLTADAGAVVWEKHLIADGKVTAPTWGFAGSPLTVGDLLILDAGPLGMAVNKNSGQVVWSSDGAGAGYSSPVPCTVGGAPAVAILLGAEVAALDVPSGKPLWRQPWKTDYDINAADVVLAAPQLFVSADYGHGSALLRLNDGATVWQNQVLCNHIQSSVLLDGYIYGVDGNVLVGSSSLKCLELATGAVKWSQSPWNGSLIIADKKIIALSDKGELIVASATSTGFSPISRAQVLGGKCWTSPVLANGRIYCRNARGDLACLDVKQK